MRCGKTTEQEEHGYVPTDKSTCLNGRQVGPLPRFPGIRECTCPVKWGTLVAPEWRGRTSTHTHICKCEHNFRKTHSHRHSYISHTSPPQKKTHTHKGEAAVPKRLSYVREKQGQEVPRGTSHRDTLTPATRQSCRTRRYRRKPSGASNMDEVLRPAGGGCRKPSTPVHHAPLPGPCRSS